MGNMNTKELWEKCLSEVELSISKANFTTWFKNTSIVREEAGTLYVGVPNEFVKDWLYNKFHKLILKTIIGHEEGVRSIEYIIHKNDSSPKNIENTILKQVNINKELPLSDLYLNKDDNLNPKYNFNSFVVGPFNELAYAVAQAIITNPGQNYNPFFVYGGTGLGKTHMIQAIGNTIKIKHPHKKIYYVSLERFAIDYINSIANKNPNSFKEKYRKYDVIIMDDIQFISGKDKTQEELFHLFNTLYENNKQIIFSSDKHPNFIQGLEDRLQSRFASGMTVQIVEPDYESRVAIIKAKFESTNCIIENDIVSYLAEILEGNIRELEGSLNTIICQSQLKNKSLSLSEIKLLIKNNIKPKKTVAIKDVVSVIANHYGISDEIIYEKTRRKEIVKARQVAMYILREDFNISYPLIGSKLGGRDHTTAIHSHLKIKEELKTDPALLQEIEKIRIMFK
ncbi:TPA: chromosomal replication initiator protein DnaA [Candidatus Nomurabacteria bacterium]|nr:MAG: Chromosomal replication initiator protein DnaA [Candidatus Nomurabacteria bacterium GW2011_GWE2_36_115]KKP93545.1 MAG: Chromosomal replication initiator protein DnaA [Candidatus Nomurabacteria bacterium GW2011_GWF2_36_126]KKP97095.1 MAG: Chromosomal replication initiator protein DnaA [Candidatus Nomurabacteria bacterium GW2011_GWD2_36_14]KKP98903.1 MAG: Chromosomal replication initiator protein DnaA [Candidatus Nomurabacteria bacterium GW2011_GWF2_36_19]KKQ05943.1 MAG: Chromosomal repli